MADALVLAVQNAPVLRALKAGGFETSAALAASLGRDKSNFAKTLKTLEGAGLVSAAGLELTAEGEQLLPRLDALEGVGDPATLTHAQLRPSPLNPRKDWTSEAAVEALDGLRASIVVNGLLQPIVVQSTPDANGVRAIIAGESRWRAIGFAIEDADLAPDWPIAVVFRDLDPAEHAKLALIENLVRRDLHALEEAEAFAALEAAGVARAEVGEIAGRTPEFIGQRVRLLKLPEEDLARMWLDPADPHFLSVTGARNLLQGRSESAGREAPAAAAVIGDSSHEDWRRAVDTAQTRALADPQQVDIEDLSPPAAPDLSRWPAPAPAVALRALEIYEACEAQNVPNFVGLAKYRPELAPADLLTLGGVAWRAHPSPQDGIPRVGWTANDVLWGAVLDVHYGGWHTAGVRRAEIARLRAELGVTDEDKGFAPRWLRGPFTADAAWLEANARAAEEGREREAAAAAAVEHERGLARDLVSFVKGAGSFLGASRHRVFADLMRRAEQPAPFRPASGYDDLVHAADGEPVTGWDEHGEPDPLRRALLATALNLACGVDPAQWPALEVAAGEDDDIAGAA